jgi:hypothetical protein
MFLLRRVLRFILLCYALYSFATGIWIIIQAENLSPAAAGDHDTLEELGTVILKTKSYEEMAND